MRRALSYASLSALHQTRAFCTYMLADVATRLCHLRVLVVRSSVCFHPTEVGPLFRLLEQASGLKALSVIGDFPDEEVFHRLMRVLDGLPLMFRLDLSVPAIRRPQFDNPAWLANGHLGRLRSVRKLVVHVQPPAVAPFLLAIAALQSLESLALSAPPLVAAWPQPPGQLPQWPALHTLALDGALARTGQSLLPVLAGAFPDVRALRLGGTLTRSPLAAGALVDRACWPRLDHVHVPQERCVEAWAARAVRWVELSPQGGHGRTAAGFPFTRDAVRATTPVRLTISLSMLGVRSAEFEEVIYTGGRDLRYLEIDVVNPDLSDRSLRESLPTKLSRWLGPSKVVCLRFNLRFVDLQAYHYPLAGCAREFIEENLALFEDVPSLRFVAVMATYDGPSDWYSQAPDGPVSWWRIPGTGVPGARVAELMSPRVGERVRQLLHTADSQTITQFVDGISAIENAD